MNAATIPTIFVSHGAPSLLYDELPAREFLQQLGGTFARPSAILCVSAHWTSATPQVTGIIAPELIYDFGGFSEDLYQETYPVAGDPALANRIGKLLRTAGFAPGVEMGRGLDHGAWVPLKLIYPAADIPVLQLSVQPQQNAAYHLAMGEALRPLREEGVLILASGSATHNLRDFFGRGLTSSVPEYVRAFDEWLADAVVRNDRKALVDYLQQAPYARENHPTAEHLLPLFVALGAGDAGEVLHRSTTYGVISMAAYGWQ